MIEPGGDHLFHLFLANRFHHGVPLQERHARDQLMAGEVRRGGTHRVIMNEKRAEG